MGEDCSGLPTQGRRCPGQEIRGQKEVGTPTSAVSRDLGSQEIPYPGRHPEKPQKPIGCLKWSSDV